MVGNTPQNKPKESIDANETVVSAQVLVVEDEIEIRELISLLLLRQGHRVQQCGTAFEAAESLKKNSYDLMVLDWMLPQMSGIDLLKSFQKIPERPPVLMVTAKAEPQDIVMGLEAGADDYITKPFEPNVFTARIKALLRRTKQGNAKDSMGTVGNPQEILRLGALSINLATYEVSCGNEMIHLTPSEFKILSTMGSHQGRVLTRDQLIETVQGEGISVTGRTIDTHVFGLRKKMGECADVIETIRGVGYRVKAEL
jgi:two-component system, OmpR family, phosphate regulon response regulator PhoB